VAIQRVVLVDREAAKWKASLPQIESVIDSILTTKMKNGEHPCIYLHERDPRVTKVLQRAMSYFEMRELKERYNSSGWETDLRVHRHPNTQTQKIELSILG